PPNGSRVQWAAVTGTTSVWPMRQSVGAAGSVPSMRATRLVRPGAPSDSNTWRSSPLPSRYARSTSLVRTSCPEPTEPSFTHWFLMSCWSSSTLSPVSVSLIAPPPSGFLEQGGERAVRALRALGGRLLGGGAGRRLAGERRVVRPRRDKLPHQPRALPRP